MFERWKKSLGLRMMDTTQKVKIAKLQKTKSEKEKATLEAKEEEQRALLDGFVRELSDVVSAGIKIDGLDSLDVACDRVEKFGDVVKTLIENIAKQAEHFAELTIPEELAVNHVTDDRLIAKLEQVGDNGALLQQLQAMDEAILLLTSAVEKIKEQGKRPEDYLPVRLVQGADDSLRFITSLNFGTGSVGGSSGGLTDAELRASPVDVALSGVSTEAKQDSIVEELQTLNSLVPSQYDYISLSYTGDNLTGVVFKTGGSGGTTVSTLTLAYSGSNLTSVTKT